MPNFLELRFFFHQLIHTIDSMFQIDPKMFLKKSLVILHGLYGSV